jgi:hypothetical protein
MKEIIYIVYSLEPYECPVIEYAYRSETRAKAAVAELKANGHPAVRYFYEEVEIDD